MDDRHQEIKTVFDRAIEIESPSERSAYLEGACADDADLRNKVEALLDAHAEAGSFLESPPADLAPTLDQPGAEAAGTLIDRYKLLQQIGEGGSGTVYMAEQKEPVRRKVALKIIKLGMDTKEVIDGFPVPRLRESGHLGAIGTRGDYNYHHLHQAVLSPRWLFFVSVINGRLPVLLRRKP